MRYKEASNDNGKYDPRHCGHIILASLALTRWVHPNWIWFTVFVGANLLQSVTTKWCLMEKILAKAGVQK